jgi:hypothetical protein
MAERSKSATEASCIHMGTTDRDKNSASRSRWVRHGKGWTKRQMQVEAVCDTFR